MPATWSNLRKVIGMFVFYSQWLQNYEVRIRPWRDLQKLQPNPGTLSQEEEQESFIQLWTNEHTALLQELKDDILSDVVLTRPNPNRRFYVKTDWSKTAFGAVLLQTGDDEES